jgi:hypothetical protein
VGWGETSKAPEAQDAFMKEADLASGMKTPVLVINRKTKFNQISNSHPHNHAMV